MGYQRCPSVSVLARGSAFLPFFFPPFLCVLFSFLFLFAAQKNVLLAAPLAPPAAGSFFYLIVMFFLLSSPSLDSGPHADPGPFDCFFWDISSFWDQEVSAFPFPFEKLVSPLLYRCCAVLQGAPLFTLIARPRCSPFFFPCTTFLGEIAFLRPNPLLTFVFFPAGR